jgi:hypothetical protein
MEPVNITTTELKAVLMPIADDVRAKIGSGALNDLAEANITGMQTTLHILLTFIHNTEKERRVDMSKLKDGLIMQTVKISEIPSSTRTSETQDHILAMVDHLNELAKKVNDPKDLPAVLVNNKIMKYQNFTGVFRKMKEAKKIPSGIEVQKVKDTFYLKRTELLK